jgi:hypothetical protein
MLDLTDIPPQVGAAFDALPPDIRPRLEQTRAEIFSEADRLGIAPLDETLKWGQPAYVPPRRFGTTLRLGQLGGAPALFVHCQTTIIEEARAVFGNEAEFSGSRALILGGSDAATSHVISAALTYHRR